MTAGHRGPSVGARFSILTQHGKEREMAPLFAGGLDVRLELAMGFDTDSFGSFTREVARQGNQLEAARAKATKGMELLALDFGIASATIEARAQRWACVTGDHFELRDLHPGFADPARCPSCNP